MKILIVSQLYPPEPTLRLRDLTAYLTRQGHDVSVITTFPSYPQGRIYPGYKLRLFTRDESDGVPVTRVFAMPYRGVSPILRAISYFSFGICAFLALLFRRKPDVIYAYHPPLTTGMAVAAYSRLRGVPFVYDVEDVWPEAIVAAGMLQTGSFPYRAIGLIERAVYRRARRVTAISDGMRDNLVSKGVPEAHCPVISNWSDPEVYHPMDVTGLRERHGWGDRFVVLSAGNLGLTHGLETILHAAARLREHRSILFVFLGHGAAKPGLVRLKEELRLDNVTFLDGVPAHEAARYINAADVMLVHIKAGDFSLPHRLFSFMLCGKAIVAAATGGTAELIRSAECGWLCPPSDPEALSALVQRVSAEPQELAATGAKGLQAANGAYGREHLLARIEGVIAEARTSP